MKECRNCKWAFPSMLEWIFCRSPIRMVNYQRDYEANRIPQGGYPQSLDHTCELWEPRS